MNFSQTNLKSDTKLLQKTKHAKLGRQFHDFQGTARKNLHVRILKEPGSAHAAADAHRDDAVFDLPAFHLMNQLHGQLRAGAAQGVAERDGAAVYIDFLIRDVEFTLAISGLRREGLVDLEEVDVFDLEPGLLQ